jgi:O-antigen ligase
MKLNDFIRAIFFLSVFFTTFIVSDNLPDPNLTGKDFYFTFIISGWLIFFIIYGSSKVYRFDINLLDFLAGSYFLYLLFNNLYLGTFILNEKNVTYMLFVVFYFTSKQILSSLISESKPINFFRVIKIKYIIFCIILCIGLFQFILFSIYKVDFQYIAATFVNSGPFAIFIGSFIPISLAILLFGNISSRWSVFFSVILFLALAFVSISFSRTSLLAVTGATMFVISQTETVKKIFKWSFKIKLKAKFIYSFLIIAGTVSLFIFFYSIKKKSADGRLLTWRISKNLINDHFWLGSGFNGFVRKYYTYQAHYFQTLEWNNYEVLIADQVNFAFNSFLNIFIESGIIGLMIFCAISVCAFYYAFKTFISKENTSFNPLWLKIGIVAFLIFIFTSMCFSYTLETLPLAISFYFVLSLISSNIKNNLLSLKINFGKYYVKTLGVVACILLLVIIKENITAMNAKQSWAESIIKMKKQLNNIDDYTIHYASLKNYGPFMVSYANCLINKKEYKKAYAILNTSRNLIADTSYYRTLGDCCAKLKKYAEAEIAYSMYTHIVPGRFVPKKKLLDYYVALGDSQNVIHQADEILSTCVKIPSPTVDSVLSYAKRTKSKFQPVKIVASILK